MTARHRIARSGDVAPGPKAGALSFVRRATHVARGGQGRGTPDTFDN